MALLTNDKNLVKEFVRINFINSTSSFPNWELAEDRHLVPLIGDEMYDKLVGIMADVNANAQDKELLKKARAIVAPLAYLIELPLIHSQLTDAGLRTINTENMQAAHRWEFNEVKNYFEEGGSFAIEALLKFLFKHKADYAEWTGSNEYKILNDLVFNNAIEFDNYFKTAQPYRVFWYLRPLIREVQDFFIIPAIGEDFFNELLANEAPDENAAYIINEIKKAVAQYTIVKAIEKLTVRITAQGFSLLLSAASSDAVNSGDDAAASSRTGASSQALSLLYASCERSGDAYLLKLKETLNKEAGANVFSTYFDSDLYEAPGTVQNNPNDNRIGIIGF